MFRPCWRNASTSAGVIPRTLPRQLSFDSRSPCVISDSFPHVHPTIGLFDVLDQLDHPFLDPAVELLAQLGRGSPRVTPDPGAEGPPDAARIGLEVGEDRREGRGLELREVRPFLDRLVEVDELGADGHDRARLADV